jgi:hypothetical protein
VPTSVPEFEEAFYEEVGAIHGLLDNANQTRGLAESQEELAGAQRRIRNSLNTRADALGVWDKIAIPVRRRGDSVFRIFAPRDVMGSPIIQALHIDQYIRGVSIKTAEDAACIARLTRRLERWRLTSLALGGIVALLLVWPLSA